MTIIQCFQSINSRPNDRELFLTGTEIGVIILNHAGCLLAGTFVPNCGVIIALGTAHGAGSVDFTFCKSSEGPVSPCVQALLSSKTIENVALTPNGSFPLTAIIAAVSFHSDHSLTDLHACRGVRIDSLQAAHLPGLLDVAHIYLTQLL